MTSKRNLILMAIVLSGCSFGPRVEMASVQVQLPGHSQENLSLFKPFSFSGGAPSSADGFGCYAVNVYGPGIPYMNYAQSLAARTAKDPSRYSQQANCNSFPALTSTVVTSDASTIQIQVPSGPSRTIEMIGILPLTQQECPTGAMLSDLPNLYNDLSIPQDFLLGVSTMDLFEDAEVTLSDIYDPTSPGAFECQHSAQIPLVSGWALSDGPSALFLAQVGNSIPPSPPALSPSPPSATAIDFSALSDSSNTVPLISEASGNSYNLYARMDFLFDVGQLNLNAYRRLYISVKMDGGVYSSTCNGSGNVTVHDVIARAWQGNAWSTVRAETTVLQFAVLDTGFSVSPAVFQVQETGTGSTGSALSGNYIYLSIQSNAPATGSNCSVVKLYALQAYLIP